MVSTEKQSAQAEECGVSKMSALKKENKELKNTIKNMNDQRSRLAKSLWESCEKNEKLEKENKELKKDDTEEAKI